MNAHQFLRILRARWLLMLVTIAVVVGATIGISLVLPSKYTATATVVVDFKGVDPISGGMLPILPITSYLATQVDIISSHNVARKAVDLLKLTESPTARAMYLEETEGRGNIRDWLANLLLRDLKVEPSRESSVINISYKGNDPRFAAAVTNAFVQSYVSTNLDLKVVPAKQTNVFFNEQINSLKSNLESTQARLSQYQRDKGIIATDERLDVENSRLNDLSSQLVAAQAQTYDSVGRQRQVQEFVARGRIPDALPDVLSNPVIQGLKVNVTQLESKLNDLSTKVGRNHPSYQAAVAELDGVRRKLLEEMRTIGNTLESSASLAQKREEQIRGALAAQRGKVLEMKRVRDDLALLMREADSAQKNYDAAMGRMAQTKLESQTTQTNIAVINEAVEPIEASSPKVMLNTLVALFVGALLAACLAVLRELSNRVVRSAMDVTELVGVPVLGVMRHQRRRWRMIGARRPSVPQLT